jgi:hypothetical protein
MQGEKDLKKLEKEEDNQFVFGCNCLHCPYDCHKNSDEKEK